MRVTWLAIFTGLAVAIAGCSSGNDEAAESGYGAGGPGASAGEGTGGQPLGAVQAGDLQSETAELKSQVGDTIHFATDSSDIAGEARVILQRQAAYMQKYPNLTFTIEGHCDERGTREYNLALGERRATAAKTALASLGVSAQRLRTISYGKERPVAVGSSPAAWAQNRRAVTVID